MKCPAYPKYKDSGVQWLGEVPEHWEVKRLSYLALLKSGENITSEQIAEGGDYPVYGGNGLRGNYSAYTHEGPFVLIGRQGALCGNINYATGRFWASEHAVVVHPLETIATRWLGELLYSMNLNQYSVSAAQPGLSVSQIGSLKIPVPPLPEQTAIADFLDRETGRIDTLVAKKRRLIALLGEKRTALISRTVTRGLPPSVTPAQAGVQSSDTNMDSRRSLPSNVFIEGRNDDTPRFKDSGIEWLGEVPEGWEVCALKRITISRCDGPFGSGLKSEHYCDDGVRVIRLQNIRLGQFDNRDSAFIDPEYYRELGDHTVIPGDVLIAGLGDENNPVGRACVAPCGIGPAMVKADCFRFRLKLTHAMPTYIALQLSMSANSLGGALATGTTRGRMNLSTTENREIVLPSLPEQTAIATYLDRETAKIDQLVAKVEEAIARLLEYRTALITAAVTGKIDVRDCRHSRGACPQPRSGNGSPEEVTSVLA